MHKDILAVSSTF